jgi:hypothetical protein
MEDRSTFIAARITASERGKASRLSNRPAVGLKCRGVAPLASRSRFWASATVLSLTAILLASRDRGAVTALRAFAHPTGDPNWPGPALA